MSVIASFIPGRLRLRSSLISSAGTRDVIIRALQSLPFVTSLTPTPSTGSLLILYRAAALPLSRLLEVRPLLEELQTLEGQPDGPERLEAVKVLCGQIVCELGSDA